jgi:L-ascorbate metabolism protein UlaG (beta-lactamase superfamily)
MNMKTLRKTLFVLLLLLAGLWAGTMIAGHPAVAGDGPAPPSDHFDGRLFFNPGAPPPPPDGQAQPRSRTAWIWRWFLGSDMPEWPAVMENEPGPPPPVRVAAEEVRVTPVGHATFLIQIDGFNLLTDPIWSKRCSPVSWIGPRRVQAPGIRFADLPPIDAVLVSHNHYDHLDLRTLRRLARRGTPRAVTTLGNRELVRESGIRDVAELDWWQSVRLADALTLTLVPAQHFSSRTLWDRNETLWGGFVVSGPVGHVYFAGDTGYGPHFREIARRFPGIRIALLPIAPYRPQGNADPSVPNFQSVHMGPAEAVQAHLDLGAAVSIAAHFQVFRLGFDGFDDAVNDLTAALQRRNLAAHAFVAPSPGQAVAVNGFRPGGGSLASLEQAEILR